MRSDTLRWTAAWWVLVYLLLTLRSIGKPLDDVLIQMPLRAVMMLFGFSLSILLASLLETRPPRSPGRDLAFLAGLCLGADLLYLLANHIVFYELPGLWEPSRHGIAKILAFLVEFFWLFPGWMVGWFLVTARARPPAAVPAAPAEGFWVSDRGERIRILADAIDWIESEGDYVRIHVGDRSHLMRATLADMEQSLPPPGHLRIHRGFIIAVRLLESVARSPDGRLKVTLAGGCVLPVGRLYAARVRRLVRPAGPKAG